MRSDPLEAAEVDVAGQFRQQPGVADIAGQRHPRFVGAGVAAQPASAVDVLTQRLRICQRLDFLELDDVSQFGAVDEEAVAVHIGQVVFFAVLVMEEAAVIGRDHQRRRLVGLAAGNRQAASRHIKRQFEDGAAITGIIALIGKQAFRDRFGGRRQAERLLQGRAGQDAFLQQVGVQHF